MIHRRFPVVALCGLTLAFAVTATSQVPEDTAVFGTFSGPISSGACGLFLVPLAGGAITPVSGLPAALRQNGGGTFQQGVNSVGLRATDGAIVVGTVASAPSPTAGVIELYLLHLIGSAVDPSRTRRIPLGTTGCVGGCLVLPMPDGRILVTASDCGGALTNGPMAGSVLAIVDVSAPTPVFTLLPTPAGSGVGGGIAVDPTGQFVYYALTTDIGSTSRVGHLHRWNLATNQSCEIATWPGQIAKGLTCDDDGTVYVGTSDLTTITYVVHEVHPDGCNPAATTTTSSTVPFAAAGLDLDRARARFVVATSGWAPGFPTTHFNSLAVVDAGSGTASVIAAPPVGGYGLMGGVAVNNAIESYGAPSDGLQRYWFENFPNPGGQPTLGNASFALTMRAAPNAPTMSMLGFSFGFGSTSVAGIEVLLDLGTTVTFAVPAGPSETFSLPLPTDPSLVNVSITTQSIHLEANQQLAASRGLIITLH